MCIHRRCVIHSQSKYHEIVATSEEDREVGMTRTRIWNPRKSIFTGLLLYLMLAHSACVTGSTGPEVVPRHEAVPKSGRITPKNNEAPTPEKMVKISFYYDANINGKRDAGETGLTNLRIELPACCRSLGPGSMLSPANTEVMVRIHGRVPAGAGNAAGKTLTVVTVDEPRSIKMLPRCILPIGNDDLEVGLADGFLTSPLAPETVSMDGYAAALRDPDAWHRRCVELYPRKWRYTPNYFYYGYRIPHGDLAGKPHHALDIGAAADTPVYAAVPGVIVQPLYDWSFGIAGPHGTLYYAHIRPVVPVGTTVTRAALVGYIAKNQGEHVHLELRPWPAGILRAFPGLSERDLLRSPLRGEAVVLPSFFHNRTDKPGR